MNLSIHVFGLPLIDLNFSAADQVPSHGHDDLQDGHQYIKIDGEVFELLPEDEEGDDDEETDDISPKLILPFGFCP